MKVVKTIIVSRSAAEGLRLDIPDGWEAFAVSEGQGTYVVWIQTI